MGGISTSHSAVLTGQKATPSSSFDLRSWQGLTEILRVGKESLKDPASYAEFRNLVLEYAQKGGDVELRKKIDAIVSTFSGLKDQHVSASSTQEKVEPQVAITSTPEKNISTQTESPVTKVTPSFVVGTRRMQPQFSAQSQKFIPTSVQKPVTEVKQKGSEPITSKVPDISKILRVTLPEKNDTNTPPVSNDVVVPVTNNEVLENVTPSTPEVTSKTLEEHKTRIAEIKRRVHEHIGNPAALMGSHNDLGKQYMTALLTALKATGTGNAEGVEDAMKNLENAFQALVGDAPSEPVVEPVTIPVQSMPIHEEVAAVETTEDPVVEEESISEPEPEAVTATNETIVPDIEIKEVIDTPIEVAEEVIIEAPEKDIAAPERVVNAPSSYPQTKYTNKGIAATPLTEIKLTAGIDPEQFTIKQTELSQPQITQSLHELLHEWSLFSGSGLFGVGPGGSEHPLYLKLAPLSMGEVLAGRWEGSDAKVVKTIKEYVDAWRHEQGIAYTINETFEHYLRRVVQKILKRQTGE